VEENHLKLNRAKSGEVVFTDNRRRRKKARSSPPLPPTIPGIERRDQLRMLGVTIANDFTVTAHVTELTAKCAQTQYALRVLRLHGLNKDALQNVFRSVVVARLLYAASVWHGLTRASDRQRINALFHRAHRQGYCPPDLPSFEELCDSADNELFGKAVKVLNHILHDLLHPPTTASQHYKLRHRTHSLQLPEHSTHLSDCNFFPRMLYKNTY